MGRYRESFSNSGREDGTRRSFSPYQWWDGGGLPEASFSEADVMWVYRAFDQSVPTLQGGREISATKLWEVGFYTPDREWMADLSFSTREEAAARVHWLMGGGDTAPPPLPTPQVIRTLDSFP